MNYQEINYINADVLIAEVQQELKSYFESGALSPFFIPTHIDYCLRKLHLLALKPEHDVIEIHNYSGVLPADFMQLDYAYLCQSEYISEPAIPTVKGEYRKTVYCEYPSQCQDCQDTTEVFERCTTYSQQGYKIVLTQPRYLRVYHTSKNFCVEGCPNLATNSTDVITINDQRRVTATFADGCIYIRYFSRPLDDMDIPMIPEIVEVEDYIKAYTKYKLFEYLWNSTADESSKQLEGKMVYYQQLALSKFNSALAYLTLPTKQQVKDSVAKSRTRFKKYIIK